MYLAPRLERRRGLTEFNPGPVELGLLVPDREVQLEPI